MAQEQLAKDLGVGDALRPRHGSRLLIISHETIGDRMAGPGIRAWQMACALVEHFEVVLAAPGKPERAHPGLRVVSYEAKDPNDTGLAPFLANCDVVLAMGPMFATMPRLRDLGKPSIVDLYDPFEMEKLAQSSLVGEGQQADIDVQSMIDLRLESLAGDFFVCASERQRDFWLGVLLASGRLNTVTYEQDPTLRALIDVVPFGLPAEPPRKQRTRLKGVHPAIATDDKLLLWNGGLWQWFDPLTLIDALVQVLVIRQDVKLFFAAGTHFDPQTVPEMPIYHQTVERCRELELLDHHVFFGDWIPYDERGDYLLEADLGISTHPQTIESHLSSRTRLLDCVWAGLPIISTAGDPLSGMIAGRGLGRTVPPGRPDLLAQAILEMLGDEGLRDRVVIQGETLREELAWTTCVEPIVAFLERVAFAPDALKAARQAAQTRQIVHKIEALERDNKNLQSNIQELLDHIEAIKQGRVMRLLRAIDVALGRE